MMTNADNKIKVKIVGKVRKILIYWKYSAMWADFSILNFVLTFDFFKSPYREEKTKNKSIIYFITPYLRIKKDAKNYQYHESGTLLTILALGEQFVSYAKIRALGLLRSNYK